MKITIRRPRLAAASRSRVEEFVDAFLQDHASDPDSLPENLRAFVKRHRPSVKERKNAR